MPKIKHIAIATQAPDKTAGFYKDVFGSVSYTHLTLPTSDLV